MRPSTRTVLLLTAALGGMVACAEPAREASAPPSPRNVILFVGDGMGAAQIKAYRMLVDDPSTPIIEPLPFDSLRSGAVVTDSITLLCDLETSALESCERDPYGITDSAASATAYATGRDTINGMLGQGPDGERYVTVLELAAERGKGTGVVSTSQVTHASPAAFVAHVASRRAYSAIADQFVDNRIDGAPVAQVILGGGVADFRRDDRDVAAELIQDHGYVLVEDAAALSAAVGTRLLGLFAPVGLPRHWDRPDSVPSLADMTRKAIDVLSPDPEGFFLVVEGSQIDWASHGNDIAGVVSEMEGFTEAISAALEFAADRDDTLIVITADHETGGLSLARDGVYAWNPRDLRLLDVTPAYMAEAFVNSDDDLADIFAAHARLELSETERAELAMVERDVEAASEALVELLNLRTLSGWTTEGHTGVDVPLYAYGPGSEAFRGTLQNEELGQRLIMLVAP
jgi:alkaline phosphatase